MTVATGKSLMKIRKLGISFFFVGWDCLSLGFHVCLSAPNIEIHLPFGFVKIGWHVTEVFDVLYGREYRP